jgi:hypothetical protein
MRDMPGNRDDGRALNVPWSADQVPAALDARMRAALQQVLDAAALSARQSQADATFADEAPVDTAPTETAMPWYLGEAALLCLRDAAALCDHRDAAIHLLAADALLTAACESAADAGDLGSLRELCDAFDVERIAARVDESA